jgi:hypothetical protein
MGGTPKTVAPEVSIVAGAKPGIPRALVTGITFNIVIL